MVVSRYTESWQWKFRRHQEAVSAGTGPDDRVWRAGSITRAVCRVSEGEERGKAWRCLYMDRKCVRWEPARWRSVLPPVEAVVAPVAPPRG